MPTQQTKLANNLSKTSIHSKLERLEPVVGTNFKNKSLLQNAFIHRSYLNENKDYKDSSNERLEFLGDSVLSIFVSKFLYDTLPNSPEGELTQLRAALVRTETLAKISRKFSLGEYLYLSKGEEDTGGRNNDSTLANTFEALIGAIYLDQGFEAVGKFIESHMLKNWKILAKSAVTDNKSKLQEIMQRKHKLSPTYKLISSWGPDHARRFQIGVYMAEKLLAEGTGKNKQQAAQNAARNAIATLE